MTSNKAMDQSSMIMSQEGDDSRFSFSVDQEDSDIEMGQERERERERELRQIYRQQIYFGITAFLTNQKTGLVALYFLTGGWIDRQTPALSYSHNLISCTFKLPREFTKKWLN